MKRSPVSSARFRSNPISIPLTGRCQYGRVRYEIIGAPLRLTAFHWCHLCQRRTMKMPGSKLLHPKPHSGNGASGKVSGESTTSTTTTSSVSSAGVLATLVPARCMLSAA